MHTEDEAKKLWCPFARSLLDRGAGNRMEYGAPDDNPVNEADCMDQYRAEMAAAFPCLASGCAMWRWAPPSFYEGRNLTERFGYCGLAGRADHG